MARKKKYNNPVSNAIGGTFKGDADAIHNIVGIFISEKPKRKRKVRTKLTKKQESLVKKRIKRATKKAYKAGKNSSTRRRKK